jgi:hypothetical protein
MTTKKETSFRVFSSHGEWEVDSQTGLVLSCERYDEDDVSSRWVERVMQFDLDEFRARYPDADFEDSGIDILDIGSWEVDSYGAVIYVAAHEQFRADSEEAS